MYSIVRSMIPITTANHVKVSLDSVNRHGLCQPGPDGLASSPRADPRTIENTSALVRKSTGQKVDVEWSGQSRYFTTLATKRA